MIYGSVCSGIEAASVAWAPLGWRCAFTSEIDPFPSAVLAHHYPDVPNYGDLTRYAEWPDAALDVLIGGTPCQSFSVAGLRRGLADPRGNLALVFLGLVDRYRPRWVVWENVPGVLSSNGGRDFGAFLGALGQLGYGWAYRVLDAQYVRVDGFGRAVPQRRRRVFVVGCAGDWRAPAAVLFEPTCLSGDSPPRRTAGESVAGVVTARAGNGSRQAGQHGGLIHCADAASTLDAHYGDKMGLENQHIDHGAPLFVAHALRADGFDASEDGTGRGTPLVPCVAPCLTQSYGRQPDNSDTAAGPMLVPCAICTAQTSANGHGIAEGVAHTLDGANGQAVIAPNLTSNGDGHTGFRDEHGLVPVYTLAVRGRGDSHELEYRTNGTANALLTPNGGRGGIGVGAISYGYAVRRLTPRECERLQGFPDDYTRVAVRHYRRRRITRLRPMDRWEKVEDGWLLMAADGPRYKALGNSMAVNVIRWLGRRIEMVEGAEVPA